MLLVSDDTTFEERSSQYRWVFLRVEEASRCLQFVEVDFVGKCQDILLKFFVDGELVTIESNLAYRKSATGLWCYSNEPNLPDFTALRLFSFRCGRSHSFSSSFSKACTSSSLFKLSVGSPPPSLSTKSSRWKACRPSNVVNSAILAIGDYCILKQYSAATMSVVRERKGREAAPSRGNRSDSRIDAISSLISRRHPGRF